MLKSFKETWDIGLIKDRKNMENNHSTYEVVKLDKNLPASVRLITRKSFRNVTSHWHRSLEINFYLDGEINFYINGVKNSYGPGDICVINSEAIHHSEVVRDFQKKDQKVTGLTLLIGYDFIMSLVPDISSAYFEIDNMEAEIAIKGKLLQLLKERKEEQIEYNNVRMLSTVCEILLILCQQCKKSKEIIQINTQRDTERIRGILSYVHENYKENLIQYEVAKKFYFSREYFSKFFKKYTGMNFKEYLTRYRLMKTEKPLLTTNITILNIAIENGFSDERQLINAFKKYYGITPNQYRKGEEAVMKQAETDKPC